MGYLPTTALSVKVIKKQKFYENIGLGQASFVKVDFSDDEIDYNLAINDIYGLSILEPTTLDNDIKSLLIYDNTSNQRISLSQNNIVFEYQKNAQQVFSIKLQTINGFENIGYIIENEYLDFINIVNTSSISAFSEVFTYPYLDSNLNVLEIPSKYQLVGNTMDLVISNNINVDLDLIQMKIYGITYPIETQISIKFS